MIVSNLPKEFLVEDGYGAVVVIYGRDGREYQFKGYVHINDGEPRKLGRTIYKELTNNFNDIFRIIRRYILMPGEWSYIKDAAISVKPPGNHSWINTYKLFSTNEKLWIGNKRIKWIYAIDLTRLDFIVYCPFLQEMNPSASTTMFSNPAFEINKTGCSVTYSTTANKKIITDEIRGLNEPKVI